MNFLLKKTDTYTVSGSVGISLSYTKGSVTRARYRKNPSTGDVEMITAVFDIEAEILSLRSGYLATICWLSDIVRDPETLVIIADYSGFVYGDYDPGRGHRPSSIGNITFSSSVNVTDKISYSFDEYLQMNATCVNTQTVNQSSFTINSNVGNRSTVYAAQDSVIKNGINCPPMALTLNFKNELVSGSSSVADTDPVISFTPCEWTLNFTGITNPTQYEDSASGSFTFSTNAQTWTFGGEDYTIPAFSYSNPNGRTVSFSGSSIAMTGLGGKGTTDTVSGESIFVGSNAIMISNNTVCLGNFSVYNGGASITDTGSYFAHTYLQLGSVTPTLLQDTSVFSNPRYVNCQVSGGYVTATGSNPHIVYELSGAAPFRFPMGRYFSCGMTQDNGLPYYPRIYLTKNSGVNSTSVVTGSLKSEIFEIRVNKSNGYYDTLDSSKYAAVASASTSDSTIPYKVDDSSSYSAGGYYRQPISYKSGFNAKGYGLSVSDSTIYSIIVTVPVCGGVSLPSFNFQIGSGFWTTPAVWGIHTESSSGNSYYRHMTFISNNGAPIADIYSQAPPEAGDINLYSSSFTSCVTIGNHESCVYRKLPGGKVRLTANCICSIDYDGTSDAEFNLDVNDGSTYPVHAISKDFTIGLYLGLEGGHNLARLLGNLPELRLSEVKDYDPFGTKYYKPVVSSEPLSISSATSEPIGDSGYYITYVYDKRGNFGGNLPEDYVTLSAQANAQPILYKNNAICKCSGCVCHSLGFNGEK